MTKLPKTTSSQSPLQINIPNATATDMYTYHSHCTYNHDDKAILGRNSSFPAVKDLYRLGPFKYSTREWIRSNPKKRAQSAHLLSKWKREEKPIEPRISMDINSTKIYNQHLSHSVYGKITLSWDKKPKWKLQNEYEKKLQHLAHKKVRELWRARNVPDYNPIPSYDKLITSSMKLKTPKKRKSNNNDINPYKDKKKKYLKPGPIFSKIHIESNNCDNKSIVHKGQQIIIDIDTRLRTHRPKVILWPSQFYKQWNLKSKSNKPRTRTRTRTRKRPKTSKSGSNTIISRWRSNKSMNFTNTFSNSYLYSLHQRNYSKLQRKYDVEIEVIEKAIGSKKWRAIFNVDSHQFVNGIVPFIVTTTVLKKDTLNKSRKTNSNKKLFSTENEFTANMTTDNSYVMFQPHIIRKKSKKKRENKQSPSKKRKKRSFPTKTKRKEIVSMMKDKLKTNDLESQYNKLKGSINDIEDLLYNQDDIDECDKTTTGSGQITEQELIEIIKNELKLRHPGLILKNI